MITFFWLLVSHALCDYPLQGEFLAKAKQFRNPIPGIDPYIVLTAHALIHGGGVALVTGSTVLGVIEALLHWSIDWLKCAGFTTFRLDQALHVNCKIAWALVVVFSR